MSKALKEGDDETEEPESTTQELAMLDRERAWGWRNGDHSHLRRVTPKACSSRCSYWIPCFSLGLLSSSPISCLWSTQTTQSFAGTASAVPSQSPVVEDGATQGWGLQKIEPCSGQVKCGGILQCPEGSQDLRTLHIWWSILLQEAQDYTVCYSFRPNGQEAWGVTSEQGALYFLSPNPLQLIFPPRQHLSVSI